jgi:protein PhnA
MSDRVCALCQISDVLEHPGKIECLTCGHEWVSAPSAGEAPQERVVKDAYGNVLENADVVAMVKDLKLKGASDVLKVGTKSRPIRLVDGDHEIDCKMNGISIALKAMYVKKVI